MDTPDDTVNSSSVYEDDQEYMGDDDSYTGDEELVRWEGVEYIHRERSARWFLIFGIVVVALLLVAIFLIKSWTFALLIPVMAFALIVYTRRPPAHIQYTLSRKGLHVNDQLQPYDSFRAFSVVMHEGHNMIQLLPRKRFSMAEMVYFPDEVGEVVVDMLAARLPMKDASPDLFDRLITRLKL